MILISMTSLVCVLLNIHHELLVEAKYAACLVTKQALPLTLFQVCVPSEPDWLYWRSQADLLIPEWHNTCLTEAFTLTLWGHRRAADFSYTSPQCFIYQSGCVLLWNTVKAKGKVNMIGSFKMLFQASDVFNVTGSKRMWKCFWVCKNLHRNKYIPALQENCIKLKKCTKLIFTYFFPVTVWTLPAVRHTVNVTTTITKHVVKCTYWCLL